MAAFDKNPMHQAFRSGDIALAVTMHTANRGNRLECHMALVKAVMAGSFALSIAGTAAQAADLAYAAPTSQTQAAPAYPTSP
jgi:hypothetical protein